MAGTGVVEVADSASQSFRLTQDSLECFSFSKKMQPSSVAEILWEICISCRLGPGGPIPCDTASALGGRTVGDVTAPEYKV